MHMLIYKHTHTHTCTHSHILNTRTHTCTYTRAQHSHLHNILTHIHVHINIQHTPIYTTHSHTYMHIIYNTHLFTQHIQPYMQHTHTYTNKEHTHVRAFRFTQRGKEGRWNSWWEKAVDDGARGSSTAISRGKAEVEECSRGCRGWHCSPVEKRGKLPGVVIDPGVACCWWRGWGGAAWGSAGCDLGGEDGGCKRGGVEGGGCDEVQPRGRRDVVGWRIWWRWWCAKMGVVGLA